MVGVGDKVMADVGKILSLEFERGWWLKMGRG